MRTACLPAISRTMANATRLDALPVVLHSAGFAPSAALPQEGWSVPHENVGASFAPLVVTAMNTDIDRITSSPDGPRVVVRAPADWRVAVVGRWENRLIALSRPTGVSCRA